MKEKELIIPVILIAGIFLVRAMQLNEEKQINFPKNLSVNELNKSYNLSLSVLPSKVCLGQELNGKIMSNMPSEKCVVYYKSDLMPFFMKQNIQLDSLGNYQGSLKVNYPIKAYAYVECSQVKSSLVNVEVINC